MFVITTKENSIVNNGFISFQKSAQHEDLTAKLAREFYDIINFLKPIAPLFESFKSYHFIMSFIDDRNLQKNLISYYDSFDDIKNPLQRLKAIGKFDEKNDRKP